MGIDRHKRIIYTEDEVMSMEKKRKTFTSYEVKKRYDSKTYRKYALAFRVDEDKELIDYIEKNKDKVGTTEIFRTALEQYIKTEQ